MTANRNDPKADRPETLRQAKTWTTNKNRYLKLGLCQHCASQASWGHSIGFSRSLQPCDQCAPVIASFAIARSNGWRSADMGSAATDRPANAGADTDGGSRRLTDGPQRVASCVCGARWAKAGRSAHCTCCHRTFANVATFDAHRSTNDDTRVCLDPSQDERRFSASVDSEGCQVWSRRSSSICGASEGELTEGAA